MKQLPSASLLLSLAVALASADAVAASPCGCTWPSADHVNTYSNIMAAADSIEGYRDAAASAYDNAKKAWKRLSECRSEMGDLLEAYRTAETDFRRFGSQISRPLLDGGSEGVKAAANTFEDLMKRLEALDGRWTELVVTDGGWAAFKRAGEAESAAIDENVQLFDDRLVEANRIYGHGIEWPCVRNLYQERIVRSRTDFESLRKNLDKAREGARNDAREADSMQAQIRGYRESVESFPAQIAANNLDQSGISTAKGLLDFLRDRSAPRVTVRFRSRGETVPDGVKSLKKEVEPLDKIVDPSRTGFVFLGWRDRNSGEMFAAWGRPVDRDLDLDAVWGYQVRVAGLDDTFNVPVEGDLSPSLSRVLLDPKFTKYAETLKPTAPGKRLAGWRDFESKGIVDGTTPVSRSMSIEPAWEDLTYTVVWRDADDTYLDETSFRSSESVRARPLPEDRGGFRYQYWSTAPDGERWTGFGRPLEYDVTLYAVRDADHVVRFLLPNGGELPSGGFRNGQEFSSSMAPEPPAQKGLVFVGWFDDRGEDFSGKKVTRPVSLHARYRKETAAESIVRVFAPVEARFPMPLVAAANVAAFVLFVVLLPRRKRDGSRKDRSADNGEAALPQAAGDDQGANAAEGAAQNPSAGDGSPSGSEPATGGKAVSALLALGLLLPSISFASSAGTDVRLTGLMSSLNLAQAASAPAFDPHVLVYPGLLALLCALVAADVLMCLSRLFKSLGAFFSRVAEARAAARTHSHGHGGGEAAAPEKEVCPTCGVDLVDGECPSGHTIVRCSKCYSIMKDGVCPRCGVGGEVEFCPTCNSELVDGECPRGHTIVRCPDCGSILQEGVCPKGCNADPLNLGWPGGAERKLSGFALQVVECPKSEGQGFSLRVPEKFVVGRSSTDAKEPFVELLTISRKEKAQCSRQYVRFERGGANGAFTVTLLNSSRNPAFVDGRKLVMQGDSAPISLGGRIKLNPGYELELVEAEAEG